MNVHFCFKNEDIKYNHNLHKAKPSFNSVNNQMSLQSIPSGLLLCYKAWLPARYVLVYEHIEMQLQYPIKYTLFYPIFYMPVF